MLDGNLLAKNLQLSFILLLKSPLCILWKYRWKVKYHPSIHPRGDLNYTKWKNKIKLDILQTFRRKNKASCASFISQRFLGSWKHPNWNSLNRKIPCSRVLHRFLKDSWYKAFKWGFTFPWIASQSCEFCICIETEFLALLHNINVTRSDRWLKWLIFTSEENKQHINKVNETSGLRM